MRLSIVQHYGNPPRPSTDNTQPHNQQTLPNPMQSVFSLVLDRTSKEPLYRQLAESIRGLIVSGNVDAGQRLPTVRDLAAQLSISPLTVHDAYRLLKQQKL